MLHTGLIKNMFKSFTFLYSKIKRTYYTVIMVNENQIEIVTSICQPQGMFFYGLHLFKMYLVNEVVFYPTKENKLFHEFEIILLLFILGILVGVTNKILLFNFWWYDIIKLIYFRILIYSFGIMCFVFINIYILK